MKLSAGDQAPPITLLDDEGDEFSSRDHQPLVVYFYPKAFTPGCTAESCDFRDRHEGFAAAGYEIVGVSPDAVDKLASFRAEHAMPFPLLSDPDHKVASAFGAWGMKKNYGKEYEGIIRSTIVIGQNGAVEQAWYNVRAKGHAERVAGHVLA